MADNLLGRDFEAAEPNTAWVGDITYLPTADGWVYLAVLLDLFSRKVVGWALRTHMRTELCLSALQQALATRTPAPGLLHHTDRGSQLGFKRSSQHLWKRSCDGEEKTKEVGSGTAGGHAFARSSFGVAA